MNERLWELAEQSVVTMDIETRADRRRANRIDIRKFADLIVRECIEQLEASKRCDPYTGDLFNCILNDNLDYGITMLKDYFGVNK